MRRAESSSFTVSGQLCFAAYSASRAITASYRAGLAAIGLTYSQYVVMLVLWEHDSVTLGYLCEQVHLDSGTLSPLLKRLERQGWITRRRRLQDERTLEVACTRAGAELSERAQAVQHSVELATGLTPAEVARLRDELQELAARLRANPEFDAAVG
ncbi:MAG: MarR family winged helix-turn-helix transcriptional regulator [Sciscionella sp.]